MSESNSPSLSNTDPKRQAQDRIRENKRRHRARRKEYLEDLEQKVLEYHRQGIQATKEVQAAALQIKQENLELRSLLEYLGIEEEVVKSWLEGDREALAGAMQGRLISTSGIQHRLVRETMENSPWEQETRTGSQEPMGLSSSKSGTMLMTDSKLKKPCSERSQSCKVRRSIEQQSRTESIALPDTVTSSSQNSLYLSEEDIDGVGCEEAFDLCMRLATTDEVANSTALSLEKGCVYYGEGTNCKVKNEVVWDVLDKLS